MGKTEELFQEWLASLKHKQPAAHVKSFYHTNRCVLTTQVKYRRYSNTTIPTDAQLSSFMQTLNAHERAVFLLLAESGERIGAIYQLTPRDIDLTQEYPLVIFRADTTKIAVTHPSFIGATAKQALLAIKAQPPYILPRPRATKTEFCPSYRPYQSIYNTITEKARKLGFRFTPHQLRKRYARKAMDARVQATVIDTLSNGLIGSRPITLDETTHCPMNYIFDPENIDKLRKIYAEKIYPAIKLG